MNKKFLFLILFLFPLLAFGQDGEEEVFDPAKELQSLGYQEINVKALADPRVREIVLRSLKDSDIRTKPREEVKATILASLKGHPLEKFLTSNPKVLEIFIDILRDEKALPGLLHILKREKDLKLYFWMWLAFFISSFWFKKMFVGMYWPWYKKIPASILFSLSMTIISFSVFYLMFTDEMHPTVTIVWRRLVS